MFLGLLASCATIAPAPHQQVPKPGSLVDIKPEADDLRPQVIVEDAGIVRPDSAEILRQLEAQNREFNTRIKDVIDRAPHRQAESVPPLAEKALGEAQPLSMNFYDADLVEVIRLFMSLLDADYILHPQVSGRVSLSVSDSYRPDQIQDLLEGILRINGMAMVLTDGVWEIMPVGRVPSQISRGRFYFPEDGISVRRGQAIQGLRLHFIPASEMATIIKPYLSENAQIYAHDANGVMLVSDFPHNLVKATQLIEVFDESVFAGVHTATYTLTFVQAEDAARELEEVAKSFGLGGENTGIRSRVSFLPLARLNILLVLARDPMVLEFVDVWVSELDRELPQYIQEQYGEGIYIYHVQYGNAAEIVASLDGLFEYTEPKEGEHRTRILPTPEQPGSTTPQDPPSGSPSAAPSDVPTETFPPTMHDTMFGGPASAMQTRGASGQLTGPVMFVVDEPNNAVLIRSNTVDYPKILSVIEQLDQYPRQVLIEVIIAEVRLTEENKLGMNWRSLMYEDGVTQSFSLSPGTPVPGLDAETGIITSFPSGMSYMIQSTARLRAAVHASADDRNFRVLSTPTLLASDNKPARINIGQELPIPTSIREREPDTSSRSDVTTTVQRRDTGIILKVTPKINRQGMVRMEIAQEDSFYAGDSEWGPIIATRQAETTVAVNDQQTVVIAGLMRQDQTNRSQGMPGLNRVPLLKYLFGYVENRYESNELIIFITPHVIIDEQDSTFISRNFLHRLDQIKLQLR